MGVLALLAGLLLILSTAPATAQTTSTADALSYLTEFQVRTNTPPLRNEYAIYNRLKGDGNNPGPARSTTRPPYKLGDQDSFWVFDLERKEYYQIRARLVALTDHVYMFLDNGYALNEDALRQAAIQFEEKVYPTNRRYFGEEWTPGVDGDPHIVILNTPLKLAAGYFSADDELLQSVNPKSNQREIIYVMGNPQNTASYLSLLSHEFQHMIHWNNQPNQDVWLNEGASVLSQTLNGFSSSGYENAFFNRPITQLNSWTCASCSVGRQYGAGYVWLSYLQDVYGFETVRNLITNGKGLTGFNAVDYSLATIKPDLSHEAVFKNWVLANYLNRRTSDPLYRYSKISGRVNAVTNVSNFPNNQNSSTGQYSAQYFVVQAGSEGFTLNFKGIPVVSLVDTKPPNGRMVWWSNRGENSDATLTREFDLSKVNKATLRFSLWHDIEPNYDNLYLEVSTNGGKTWQVLSGKYSSNSNPTGRNYGPAYSGHSDPNAADLADTDVTQAQWLQEQVDLSQYAGQKIKIRFEYLTDEGYSRQGALLDDFEIPEIGWKDNAEASDDGWEASGFIRTANSLPQKYFVQVVRQDGPCGNTTTTNLKSANDGQSCILELTLDSSNNGQLKVPFAQAVVVVAAYAPKTLVPATYSIGFKT